MRRKQFITIRQAAFVGFALALALYALYSEFGGPLSAASRALNVADTTSISFAGTAKKHLFGQPKAPNQAWPPTDFASYAQTVSYADPPTNRVQMTRKQVIDPNRVRSAPVVDQIVAGQHAWDVTPSGEAIAQPALVDERLIEVWATPHGFLKAAGANNTATTPVAEGTEVSFEASGRKFVGIINAANEVARVQSWIDNPLLGDMPVEYIYTDYADFDGVRFPRRIVRTQGGHPTLEIDVVSATRSPQDSIKVPETVANATLPAINIVATPLSEGVFFLGGGSHNSLVIERADHIVVVEGPLSEARGEAVILKAKELVPNKAIRYVINTHVHFDHSSGLRPFVAEGATIVTHEGARTFYEAAWSAPRTIRPDRMTKSDKAAAFETVSESYVLDDGNRKIEIHEIVGNEHSDDFLMVYLPAERILVEADAYSPSAAGAAPATPPNPFSVNLYENIERLSLDVATIAPLHGRVGTIADLRRDIGVPDPVPIEGKASQRK